jgi:hypothetical protein
MAVPYGHDGVDLPRPGDRATRRIRSEGKPAASSVPVAVTWTVAADRLDEPTAALLRLLAFVGAEPIPIDLLDPRAAAHLPDPLAATVSDPLLPGRLDRISKLGLVRIAADGIVLHRLVSAELRERSLREQVLARRRRILGEDHPDTLNAAADLAATLRDLGEYPAAGTCSKT